MDVIKISVVLFLTLCLGGCQSAFRHPAASADYGPLPNNYEEEIKKRFYDFILYPDSAKYTIGTPAKAYHNKGLIYGGGVAWYGWMIDVDISEKNYLGEYTGRKSYMVFFKGDRIFLHLQGRNHPLVTRVN